MRKMNEIIIFKKAQIGETMTWIVATAIISFILTISIIATSGLGLINSLSKQSSVKINADVVPVKSLSSYLLTHDVTNSGKSIFEKISNEENIEELNNENGYLASKIFNIFYNKEYFAIWLGIQGDCCPLGIENNYFGSYGKIIALGNDGSSPCFSNVIYLGEKDKWINLELCK